jgi:hypothetical protein
LTALLVVAAFSPTSPQSTSPAPGDSAAKQQPQHQICHPPAKPDDVNSLESILVAIYDVISGSAGDHDWNRFRSLFVPEARLTSATRKDGRPVRLLDGDSYARGASGYFKTLAFYESAIAKRIQKFGNVAQVFSSYASRTALTEKPFARGVNSIQLFNDGTPWWVISILWDQESSTNPLPSDLTSQAKLPLYGVRRSCSP